MIRSRWGPGEAQGPFACGALNNAAIAALIAAASAGKALIDDDCAKKRSPRSPGAWRNC